MLEKDKCLKEINFFITFLIIFFSSELSAEDQILKLIDYNQSLKKSSALIIQTSEGLLSEGTIFFGKERIRVDYLSPNKITIILSEKKGVYINHALQETQFFNTKKSYVKFFFSLLNNKEFINQSKISILKDTIKIKSVLEIDEILYKISIFYENEPIKLRKIEITNVENIITIGFFDHIVNRQYEDGFFSMIDPYLK